MYRYVIEFVARGETDGLVLNIIFLEKNAVSLVLPSNNLSSSSIILFRMK